MKVDAPLSRMTLADRLVEQLRQQILSGRFEVGDALPSEQDIGEAFGVGRTTVREALRGLVSTGLVERKAKALVVRHPDAVDAVMLNAASYRSQGAVEQVYDVRKLLEVQAVRLATANRTDEDLAAIAAYLDLLNTDELEAYHTADPEFHSAIVKASGNEVLHQLYLSSRHLFFKLPAFWRVFGGSSNGDRPRIGSGYQGHKAIFEAIEGGDVELAGRLTEDHLDGVQRGLMAAISSGWTSDAKTETAPIPSSQKLQPRKK